MSAPRRRRRHAAILGAILAGLLGWCPRAFALNPALDISQYAHTSWKVRDGFVDGTILAITQTADGYLWIGTDSGLFRFDGVRAARWQPADGQRVIDRVVALHAARDGSLWIGAGRGVIAVKDGALIEYPALAGQSVGAFAEDRDGRIWMAVSALSATRLCIAEAHVVHCLDPDNRLRPTVVTLFFDATHTLWAGLLGGIARVSPTGAVEVFSLPPQSSGYQAMLDDDDGRLLLGLSGGLARFVDGQLQPAYPSPAAVPPFVATKLLRDRDGGVWMATNGRGIVHFHGGRAERFARGDGLSDDYTTALFEDREGSVWVATTEGLERFRDVRIPRYGVEQGLSNATVTSVLAARDGTIWAGTFDGLTRLDRGRVTIFREHHQPTANGIREVTGHGFPDRGVHTMFQDRAGRIWISDRRRVGIVVEDRFVPMLDVGGRNVFSIVQDQRGDVWIATDESLARIRGDRVVEITPWPTLSRHGTGGALMAGVRDVGLWLGFADGAVGYLAGGRFDTTTESSAVNASLSRLRADAAGAIWVSTRAGLRRMRNGTSVLIGRESGLPCAGVQWSIEDEKGHVWLATPCGLVRVARRDLDARADAIERGETITAPLAVVTLDEADGYRRRVTATTYNPQASLAPDGRIWFASLGGVGVIDPSNLRVNSLAPAVHIEQLIADRKTHDATPGLRLPPRIRDLEIDYTALSLVAPEKNRFRIRLEGRDRDWQDVGTRRQAFYTDLGPGSYRFRVVASNNSGVWNETGATLEFAIAPAYYQTRWFAATVAIGTLALLWVGYQLRIRQVARQFNRTLDARVSERTRIARDLHDTLLQSFQGALLRFQSVANVFTTRPDEARERLDRALDQAEAAITEGRNAVQGLRTSAVTVNDLANGIAAFGAALTSDPAVVDAPAIEVGVDGHSRDLSPLVRDEAYRIAGEALRNAVKHARARRVIVTIHYEPRQLRVTVYDDGKGVDAETLARQQTAGHFGVPGMRERAAIVKGQLDVRSAIGAGTEIELRVPAAIAYAAATSWWSRVVGLFGRRDCCSRSGADHPRRDV